MGAVVLPVRHDPRQSFRKRPHVAIEQPLEVRFAHSFILDQLQQYQRASFRLANVVSAELLPSNKRLAFSGLWCPG